MMLFGGVLFLGMVVVCTIVLLHAYFHYGPDHIPDLSWYLYGAGGGVGMSATSYAVNRFTAGKQVPIGADEDPDDLRHSVATDLAEGEGDDA
jgi:hypothetical protein